MISGVGASILPFAIMWTYLRFLLRGERQDELAIAVSVAVGLISLNLFPLRLLWRVSLSLVYMVAMPIGLFLFGLGYVCAAYRSCL
jgi:hypothetical protein